MPHIEMPTSRRDFLMRAGGGLGAVALAALLDQDGRGAAPPSTVSANPLVPKPPHFKATAKSVIWCFIDGGPSHLDLFDPKPELTKLHGKTLPGTFRRPITPMGRTADT